MRYARFYIRYYGMIALVLVLAVASSLYAVLYSNSYLLSFLMGVGAMRSLAAVQALLEFIHYIEDCSERAKTTIVPEGAIRIDCLE